MNEKWSPEREEQLRMLWTDGLSARVIGGIMDITRSAVIGKAYRIKLESRKRSPNRFPKTIRHARPNQEPPPPPPPPEPLNVTIHNLTSKNCRYIVDKNETGEVLYCGHDKKINFYCAYHANKCYNYEALAKVRYKSSFGHRLPGASFPQPPLALRKGTCL